MKKRIVALFLALSTFITMAGGCSAKQSDSDQASGSPTKSTAKQNLSFWYMWTGTDAKAVEQIISDYNKSQDTYVVKGLSVPDEKKIKSAIASGNGPDITDSFSSNIAAYASKGILECLDDYIKKDNFTKDFVPSAMKTVTYDGKVWALPTGAGEGELLYYNKDLLKEAGYSEPPKTFSEMCAIADKTTKKDADGNLSVMGFPDFPFVYYTNNMAYALGGNLISSDGKTLTPDDPAIIQALKAISSWRQNVGVEKVKKFESSTGAYNSGNDPFVTGHQALRFDGTWFIATIKQYNPNLNYGIALLPYPDGKPELAGGGVTGTSILYIPNSSKNKDGAWSFMEYIEGEQGMKTFAEENGFIPARKALWNDSKINSMPGFKIFTDGISRGTTQIIPAFPNQDQYTTELSTYYEKAANGEMTPEAAMKECKSKCASLLTSD